MLKKIILTTLGILLVAGAIVGTKISQFKAMGAAGAAMVPPPETVTSAAVVQQEWENRIAVTGTLVAVQGVTVGAEVAGKVVKLGFEAGAPVQAGDLLVQLDISTEQAQLRAADATAALAQANLARSRELRNKDTNSAADLDAAEAQAKQAAAQADSIRAIIAKKSIRAPFSGRLGIRLVNLGQILRDGDPIVTLQTLDPIYVNFAVPQQRLSQLVAGNLARITSDAAPGEVFDARINAINPDVDTATRNVRVQATISNPAERLRPGMFANVSVIMPAHQTVLAIPVTAVLYSPSGNSVFVIEDRKDPKTARMTKILRQQFVQLGAARGDFVSVTTGLKVGEQVVTTGVFKLRREMTVIVDNTLAPSASLTPTPKDS